MFFKAIIGCIVVTFFIQNALYYLTRSRYDFEFQNLPGNDSHGLIEISEMAKLKKEQAFEAEKVNLDLWNCINLYLGGNISPSIVYKQQFWRLATCFFIHENFYHLFFNVLIILSYSKNQKIKQQEIIILMIPALINGNLISALIYPEFLKIGSSLLSFCMFTLSVLSWKNLQSLETLINFSMACFLAFSVSSGKLDNSIHYFAIAITCCFKFLQNRKKIRIYCIGNLFLFFVLSAVLFYFYRSPEYAFAAEIDFGCSFVYDTLEKMGNRT